MAHRTHKKLGEFFSTAICGNDILSSALYVSGIAAIFAGTYAPLVLLAVGAVLFVYRGVYREVVEALPVNGGAYNALLNAASKTFAALAGVMTILSYTATAVISAKTAIEYLCTFLDRVFPLQHLPLPPGGFEAWTLPSVILLLFAFAVLIILGVSESARIAAGIFIFHLFSLTIFVTVGLFIFLVHGNAIGAMNTLATQSIIAQHGGLLKTLFLAFSISLLGVSGFESSANFVEEQKHGVFAKTLRNMTLGVAIFNPLIAFVILRVMPLQSILASKDFLLAEAASRMGGTAFLSLIAIDAFLVLAGAVLTSYVGMSGLVKRMVLDGCLPQGLIKKNSNNSINRIVLVFFLLCSSILFLTNGDLLSLAGVYTISFLSVMTLFALGNLILRATRGELQRPYRAAFPLVLIALCSTLIGLIGNFAIDPKNAAYFLTYFIPATFIVLSVLYKKDFYDGFKKIFRGIPPLHRFFLRKHAEATAGRIYVFIHHISRLSPILEYIKKNESATNITLVHCKHKHHHIHLAHQIEHALQTLHISGFFQNLNYNVEYLDEPFAPKLLDRYAKQKKIQKNQIFIGSIHHSHDFTYEELGGVRIIF